jgi:hypothetical protein
MNEAKFQYLSRKMKITAKCRFKADRRLKHHNTVSNWTISFLSAGLILIPLIEVFKLQNAFHQNVINFLSIFLAIAVLVISIILNNSLFALRAERMLTCGREINALVRKSIKYTESGGLIEDYDALSNEYEDILKNTENHSGIDFDIAKLDMADEFPLRPLDVPWTHLKYAAQFIAYFILIAIEFTLIAYLLLSKNNT